jgi:hypothetical protein
MTKMRAKEYSGIREELKTSGISKEKLHMGKKLLQYMWQQVCYGLIGSARGKIACMFATIVDEVAT